MLCVGWNVIPLSNLESCLLPIHSEQQTSLGDDANVLGVVLVQRDDRSRWIRGEENVATCGLQSVRVEGAGEFRKIA